KRVNSGRYIFTSFTNSEQNQLYVWTSDDGTNFSKWAGPVWSPPSGLLRDPSWILTSADLYLVSWIVLVLLKLRSYTTDWSGSNFGIAKSTTMLNGTWNFVANISTATGGFTPVNTWAPEFFKDPVSGKFGIVV
ncbi:glycoside hydrolase family 43 protein, partial [Sphaerobolus stellatus SS14]